ncbi:MAG TPA: penicillin-binding protein activator LpoB [Bdellovibrionota bacterium]|nr:penicillin-binding protein activator LpoB [Bdellovibrionota bacterium]
MKNLFLLSLVLALTACGPRAFIKGDYDKDPESENLLTDQWSETDMQVAVHDLVNSMVHTTRAYGNVNNRRIPIVMVTNLQNQTSEHINTESIMDMVRVEITKNGQVQFVDKQARGDIKEEYEYQEGMVTEETKSKKGSQIGADYILNGRLDSIVQEAGSKKTVYYKLTMNLTDLKSGLISWTDQKQIRKLYKKQHVGL